MEDATFAVSGNDTLHYRVGEAEKRLASLEAKNEQILKDLSANTRAVDRLIVLLESCPEHQRKARYADAKATQVEKDLGVLERGVGEDFASLEKNLVEKIDVLAKLIGKMQENNIWLIRLVGGAVILALLSQVLVR